MESFLPSFQSKKTFNVDKKKVFQSIVYSKIGTEIVANRWREFIAAIARDIVESRVSGLYFGLALIQLADDDKQKIGAWLEKNDIYFQYKLIGCCRLLSSLLIKENLSFNNNNFEELNPMQVLCLLVLSFYQRYDIKKWTSEVELNRNDIIYPDNNPIERMFVPNFYSSDVVEWQDASKFFIDPPECVEIYDDVKVAKDGATSILLMQLPSNQMKKEWIPTVFLNNNLQLFGRKHKHLYDRFIRKNLIRTSLVNYQNTLCVTFSCSDDNNIRKLTNLNEMMKLEPAYAIVASTLAPYIRMLYKIDPSLEIKEYLGSFFSYIDGDRPQVLFHTSNFIIREETFKNRSIKKNDVFSIDQRINRFLSLKNWIDESCNNKKQLIELFETLKLSVNDEAFIQAGANFISKIINVPLRFIKFEKSVKEMKEEFNFAVGKQKEFFPTFFFSGYESVL